MNLEAFPHTHTPQLPIQLDQIQLSLHRSIYIVRDDLLPAGTKQRAIIPLLRDFQQQEFKHMIYASPFAGFAQVALAFGCHSLGLKCTLFCEKDPHQPGMKAHLFTNLAKSWGANIVIVETLAEAEERAQQLADERHGLKIPLGFHCPEFQHHFQIAIEQALGKIRQRLGFLPNGTWLPVGSGTFVNAFHKVAPITMKFYCVDVHVLKPEDPRILALRSIPRVQYFSAQENFQEMALVSPPLPSNIHYDAKLWSFVSANAEDGDLWWNVAR